MWGPWRAAGFECDDTGIGEATGGLAGARNVRATADGASPTGRSHDGELLFWYVVDGSATLELDGRDDEPLEAGRRGRRPARDRRHRLVDADGLELLEVTLPG